MSLRSAYKMVIKNELEILVNEREWDMNDNKINELVDILSEEDQFLQDMTNAIEEHLENFGENYGLQF